jgi:hypothetical protein
MKGPSEAKFREGLVDTGMNLLIYKPPDDARNWKPCDFMVWWHGRTEALPGDEASLRSAWFEVKENTVKAGFNLKRELRPAQRGGIREAIAVGLPYYLAIWWKTRGVWTISEARPFLELDGAPFEYFAGKYGIDALPSTLGSVLAAVLRGELL